MGGVEKLILKLTSASTGVGVEARAELGNKQVQTGSIITDCTPTHTLNNCICLFSDINIQPLTQKYDHFG